MKVEFLSHPKKKLNKHSIPNSFDNDIYIPYDDGDVDKKKCVCVCVGS